MKISPEAAAECSVFNKLLSDSWLDLYEKDPGLLTLWWPYKQPDPYTGEMMAAIPEHQKLNRKFNKHKKECPTCNPEQSKQ